MTPPMRRREFLQGALVLALSAALPGRSKAGGRRTIPRPLGTVSSRWGQDPFALGAYSYGAPGCLPTDRDTLEAPVGTSLYFAGEATSTDYSSTVHGAWISGVKAAERVLASGARSAVVVGAGMAGLAAARTLLEAGVSVEVVEARQRPGGRMITDHSLGLPADLGASWIHGPRGNPVARLARDFDLSTRVFDGDALLARPDGKRSGVLGLMNPLKLLRVVNKMEAAGDKLGLDGTLQQAADAAIASVKTSPEEEHLLRQLAQHGYASSFGADPDQISWSMMEEGEGFAGADRVIVAGYSALIERLAEDLDIRFGEIVKRVDTTGPGARVVTQKGEFAAEAVVVTLPLGVLQAGSVAFEPALPAQKQGAIDRLGMGQCHKLVLLFDEVFWDDAEFIVYLRPQVRRSPVFFNLHRTTGKPALVMWHAGRAATAMEARSEQAVTEDALDALEAMYGHA